MSTVSSGSTQEDTPGVLPIELTPEGEVPLRPWAATYNKRLGHWTVHHLNMCKRGETSRIFAIDMSLDDEADARLAKFVVDAVNSYAPKASLAILDALQDCVALLTGDITGAAQRESILAEAQAAIRAAS